MGEQIHRKDVQTRILLGAHDIEIDQEKRRAVFNVINAGTPISGGPEFTAEVLKASTELMEGVSGFMDHFEPGTSHLFRSLPFVERSIKSLGGFWNNSFFSEQDRGINATFNFIPSQFNIGLWDLIVAMSDHGETRLDPKTFGISLHLDFNIDVDDTRIFVRSINKIFSADFVINPARGGEFKRLLSSAGVSQESEAVKFYLSTNPKKEVPSMGEKDEDLIRENEKLKNDHSTVKTENVALSEKAEADEEKHTGELKSKDNEIALLKNKQAVATMLSDKKVSELPEALRTRITSQVKTLQDGGKIIEEKFLSELIDGEKKYFASVVAKETPTETDGVPAHLSLGGVNTDSDTSGFNLESNYEMDTGEKLPEEAKA